MTLPRPRARAFARRRSRGSPQNPSSAYYLITVRSSPASTCKTLIQCGGNNNDLAADRSDERGSAERRSLRRRLLCELKLQAAGAPEFRVHRDLRRLTRC